MEMEQQKYLMRSKEKTFKAIEEIQSKRTEKEEAACRKGKSIT